MESQGYQWGKIKPEDVYIPPPPPRWGWVKAGVSERDARDTFAECNQQASGRDFVAQSDKCMEAQGFKWEVIDPHPKNAY